MIVKAPYVAMVALLVGAQTVAAQGLFSVPSAGLGQAEIEAAIAAATPAPCPAPLADTLTGTAGVQPVCMTRPDATRPAIIQSTMVTTSGDGSFSGTWPVAFASPPTGRIADIDIASSSNAPYTCSFIAGSVTSTGFAGKCWQIVATTFPTTVTAILGLVVSPLNNAAGGLTVRVTGRQ